MVLCANCQRVRPKHDQHLIEQGLMECRPCDDPSAIMRAFWTFAEQHVCSEPFYIEGSGQHKESAWPFQYHPEAIARCSGYLPR